MTHLLCFRACVRDKNSNLCLELGHVSGSKYIYRLLVRREHISEPSHTSTSKALSLVTQDGQRLVTMGLG